MGTHSTIQIYQNQTACSWGRLLWGMWSKAWEESTRVTTETANDWLHKVILRIWKGIKEQWEDRNKIAIEQGGLDYNSIEPLLNKLINEIKEVEERNIPTSMKQVWRKGPSSQPNKYLWIQTMLTILPQIKKKQTRD